KGAALLHLCMSLNQPILLVGVVSGLLAALLAPSLIPLLLALFGVTLAWVLTCATIFLRAGHNFIRGGALSPAAFAWELVRFVDAKVACMARSLAVHVRNGMTRPKPIVFDRTPKRGT